MWKSTKIHINKWLYCWFINLFGWDVRAPQQARLCYFYFALYLGEISKNNTNITHKNRQLIQMQTVALAHIMDLSAMIWSVRSVWAYQICYLSIRSSIRSLMHTLPHPLPFMIDRQMCDRYVYISQMHESGCESG